MSSCKTSSCKTSGAIRKHYQSMAAIVAKAATGARVAYASNPSKLTR